MSLFGVVRLTRRGSEFTVFSGVGSIGRQQVYDWSELTSVQEQSVGGREATPEIVLVGTRRVGLGRRLSDERRHFVREVLRLEMKRGH